MPTVRRLLASARRDGPLLAACVALVVFGIVLRTVDLGFPHGLSWDEHHFVVNARNYLHREHDWNDHPPLGKLLLSLGFLAFGDTSVGWRAVPVVFGLANIVLSRALAAFLFRDRRAGWIAAAFAAADGFLIAYSRTALLDGMLTTFVLATAWCALRARVPRHFALVGLLIGAAASIKMSGFSLGLPALLLCLRARRPIACAATLVLAPVLYVLQFSLGLWIAREPHTPWDAISKTLWLIAQARGANQFTHPLTSHWYTWFLPTRPIMLRYDAVGPGRVRVMTSLGNLLLWWSAAPVLVAGAVASVRSSYEIFRARRFDVQLGRTRRALAALFAFALSMLLLWFTGARDSYIYHYLPTYALLLVATAGLVSRLYRRSRLPALVFVLAVGVVSCYYAPVWGQLELSTGAFRARLFLPFWR